MSWRLPERSTNVDVRIHVLPIAILVLIQQLERYLNLFLISLFDPLTSRKVLEIDFYLDINL